MLDSILDNLIKAFLLAHVAELDKGGDMITLIEVEQVYIDVVEQLGVESLFGFELEIVAAF